MSDSTSIPRLDNSIKHPLWIEGQTFLYLPEWRSVKVTSQDEYEQMKYEIEANCLPFERVPAVVAMWCLFNALYFTDYCGE